MKSIPSSAAMSMIANGSDWSRWLPKIIVPRQSLLTCSPRRPTRRPSISTVQPSVSPGAKLGQVQRRARVKIGFSRASQFESATRGVPVMAKAKKKAKTGWSRRKFLQTAGVAASTIAFPEIIISCGPQSSPTPTASIPKPRKGASIRLLQWTSFVKPADAEFKRQAAEWGDANGVTVAIETVTGDQLQPKTAAAVEAGSGPDIIQMQYGWPQLYTDSWLAVSNEVNLLISKLGKPDPVNEALCKVNGVWRAIPYTVVPNAWTYRTDYFQQAGVSSFPTTWDELTAAAAKLKGTGKPISQTDGHAYGDSLTMWNPVLWGYGGKEVNADGKTVAINSKETRDAIRWAQGAVKAGFVVHPDWLDPDNNQAYHPARIRGALNGGSIQLPAKIDVHHYTNLDNQSPLP